MWHVTPFAPDPISPLPPIEFAPIFATDSHFHSIAATMTVEALVDGLSSKFELSKQNQDKLRSTLHSDPVHQPESNGTQSAVGLSPVSTFVAEKSFSNFAVPHFATHWGVVCDFPDDSRMLFHLLYNPSNHKMVFQSVTWMEEWSKHSVTRVGTTPYGFTKVNWIGC